jgi:maltose alpha-D-glucosyltransferase/alpha-amylase
VRDRTRRRWFENAVFYSLDVSTYADGNDDGTGDFVGLIDRLDHLSGLGVDALWLQPFYFSPNRDNRYDVADYFAIDPKLGDFGDVTRFLRECDQRGIRVLIELVVNHTSVDHPWFQEARRDPTSPKRDYYVWRDEPPHADDAAPEFAGVEDSVWEWDDVAGQWYLHHFYAHQPDLNIANPAVRAEIAKIAEFWLDLGVSGFRLDAAAYIAEKAAEADPIDEGMWFIRGLRELVATYGHDAVLLAEADVEPKGYDAFFADGEGINVMLDFWTNERLFLALARDDPQPILQAIDDMPAAPTGATYANWARNHDELDLDMLSDEERDEVCARFAPDERARAYGRGIRRRLAPMLDGDRSRIELTHSVVFGLRGVPILRYGDEIGMGDDLDLPERTSVRTAMQWCPADAAGFSVLPPDQLGVPLITEGPFAPTHVNVTDQRSDASSLLNAVGRLIRARRESPEIGTGTCTALRELIELGVLGFRHDDGRNWVTVTLHHFGDAAVEVEVPVLGEMYELAELTSDRAYGSLPRQGSVALGPRGYRWFRGRVSRPD